MCPSSACVLTRPIAASSVMGCTVPRTLLPCVRAMSRVFGAIAGTGTYVHTDDLVKSAVLGGLVFLLGLFATFCVVLYLDE